MSMCVCMYDVCTPLPNMYVRHYRPVADVLNTTVPVPQMDGVNTAREGLESQQKTTKNNV